MKIIFMKISKIIFEIVLRSFLRWNEVKNNFKYFRLSHDLHQASENSYFKPEERSFRGGEPILANPVILGESFPSQNYFLIDTVTKQQRKENVLKWYKTFEYFCVDFEDKKNSLANSLHRNQDKNEWILLWNLKGLF